MKRYWLFGGETYYARGGMWDFIIDSNDIDDLYVASLGYDWFHIYDSHDKRMTVMTPDQAHSAPYYDTDSPNLHQIEHPLFKGTKVIGV